ncbi:MAG: hypothetical protein MZV64_18360, partial [Ignavibacteriales bacterium]|nr:hypothetical protein [Ignavibacteriales bacterium]
MVVEGVRTLHRPQGLKKSLRFTPGGPDPPGEGSWHGICIFLGRETRTDRAPTKHSRYPSITLLLLFRSRGRRGGAPHSPF